MITCFKIDSDLVEEHQYSSPPKDAKISEELFFLLQRIGVISKKYKLEFIEKDIIKSIPFGRENFLLERLEELSYKKCTKINPKCSLCILNEHCDYKNEKNDWIIN